MEEKVKLQIRNMKKHYKNGDGVENINMDVREGEFLTMLGPSGCGKSTILRTIGGFLDIDDGDILIDGCSVKDLAPENRPTAMVFQSYNLWPHMTVYENLAFGLKIKKYSKEEISRSVKRGLELVNMQGFEKKYPGQLSGGQQQRVAIARALLLKPSVLLLDEPFSALDAKIRAQMREELKKIQEELKITVVFVTHDQEEAMALSHRIVVMNKGVIEQIGRPDEIYNHSATEFVCNFIGDINRLEENFLKASGAGLCAGVDLQKHCYIRLERMHVNGEVGGDAFQIEATVKNMEYYGLYIKYTLEAGGQQLKVIEKNSGKPLYDAGEKVTVSFRQEDIMQYEG